MISSIYNWTGRTYVLLFNKGKTLARILDPQHYFLSANHIYPIFLPYISFQSTIESHSLRTHNVPKANGTSKSKHMTGTDFLNDNFLKI